MKKFEYLVETIAVRHFEEYKKKALLNQKMNELGAKGWELESMSPIVHGSLLRNNSNTISLVLVFKREL